jgi:diadenosine tetraphosphate (Ap4A) HIT family hydrolase
MRAVAADAECFSSIQNARADLPPRERLHVGPRWRIAHAFGTSLPGWLVALPCRHATAIDQLTVEEATDLGPPLCALSAALCEVLGCSKTYVALFAEAEGFAHVHFHVVPRQPNLDPGLRGPRVFGLLGGDPASHVPAQVMDEVTISVGQALRLGPWRSTRYPLTPHPALHVSRITWQRSGRTSVAGGQGLTKSADRVCDRSRNLPIT